MFRPRCPESVVRPPPLPRSDTIAEYPGYGPQLRFGVESAISGLPNQGEQPYSQVVPGVGGGRGQLAGSDSAGWPSGTPSSADASAPLFAARSAALICSQFALTSSAPATATSANTCGCRRTSLSTIPAATSSMVNAVSSVRSAATSEW